MDNEQGRIGYRAWVSYGPGSFYWGSGRSIAHQLCPVSTGSTPWVPGVNRAECACAYKNAHFFNISGFPTAAQLANQKAVLESQLHDMKRPRPDIVWSGRSNYETGGWLWGMSSLKRPEPSERELEWWRMLARQIQDLDQRIEKYYVLAKEEHTKNVPVQGCTCGWWTLPTLAQVLKRFCPRKSLIFGPGPFSDPSDSSGYVYGAVRYWGKTIVHETGTRAQFAQPIALLKDDSGLAKRAAQAYDIPLLGRVELEALS